MRHCPLHYRTRPEAFRDERPGNCHAVVYVAGGLYGNPFALLEIMRMRDAESRASGHEVALVFNGDFHWLDCDPASFSTINDRVLRQIATAGNVELELAQPTPGQGCGCNYPEWVPAASVDLSDRVMARLSACAESLAPARQSLAELPLHLTVRIGEHRVGILHGDPESVAGWGFAVESMPAPEEGSSPRAAQIADWFQRAQVSVFACSHTSKPFIQEFRAGGRRCVVANNGSAGLPNFSGQTYGVVTRLSAAAEPSADALYGVDLGGLRVEALPVRYDHAGWQREFERLWPEGSAGFTLYAARVRGDIPHSFAEADRLRRSTASTIHPDT